MVHIATPMIIFLSDVCEKNNKRQTILGSLIQILDSKCTAGSNNFDLRKYIISLACLWCISSQSVDEYSCFVRNVQIYRQQVLFLFPSRIAGCKYDITRLQLLSVDGMAGVPKQIKWHFWVWLYFSVGPVSLNNAPSSADVCSYSNDQRAQPLFSPSSFLTDQIYDFNRWHLEHDGNGEPNISCEAYIT